MAERRASIDIGSHSVLLTVIDGASAALHDEIRDRYDIRPGEVDARLDIETPDLVADAFTPGRTVLR